MIRWSDVMMIKREYSDSMAGKCYTVVFLVGMNANEFAQSTM